MPVDLITRKPRRRRLSRTPWLLRAQFVLIVLLAGLVVGTALSRLTPPGPRPWLAEMASP